MNEEQFRNYSTEDFIGDETFIRWIQNPDQEQDIFWAGFLKNHPDKKMQVSEAASVIRSLQVVEPVVAESDLDRVFSRINESYRKEKREAILYAGLRYAATFLVLVLAGSILIYLLSQNDRFPLASMDQQDSGKGRVILSDGSVHEFEKKETHIEHDPSGSLVINNDTIRAADDRPVPDKAKWIKVIVPYGKITRVSLSDGTRIWLNSGSQLAYPDGFTSGPREVFLAGEAFFDVEKDMEKPFVVTTEKLKIRVLGTQFNVSSYPDDMIAETVLVEGKVTVTKKSLFRNSFEMMPGERISFFKQEDKFFRDEVDVEQFASWIHEYLVFENAPVTAVLKKLERFYNLNILYRENELEQLTFSGKLDLKENLGEVLDIIAYASDVSVKEQHGDYVITP